MLYIDRKKNYSKISRDISRDRFLFLEIYFLISRYVSIFTSVRSQMQTSVRVSSCAAARQGTQPWYRLWVDIHYIMSESWNSIYIYIWIYTNCSSSLHIYIYVYYCCFLLLLQRCMWGVSWIRHYIHITSINSFGGVGLNLSWLSIRILYTWYVMYVCVYI